MVNFSLTGKVALVTGAAYGIGFAIAQALAEAGARIAFNCRSTEHLETAKAEYARLGIEARGYICDVTKESEVASMVADIRKPQFAPIITSMGIETQVNLLEEENERFAQLASQRSQDDSDTKKLETNKELRAQLTTLYNAIADHAFAANLLHGTDETANFIKDLNSHIEETVEDYNRRGPNDDEEEGEDETPGGTETPENPDGETPEEPDDRPVVQ